MAKKLITLLFAVVFIGVLFMHFVDFMLPMKYENEIKNVCLRYNVEEELVYAVIKTESNFDKAATSNKEAKGLMQLTDDTAAWCAQKMNWETFSTEDIYDPEINITLGVWYLSYLTEETGSQDLAIIAYNAGINRVRQWISEGLVTEDMDEDNEIPYPETKDYLKKVKYYKNLYGYRLGKK